MITPMHLVADFAHSIFRFKLQIYLKNLKIQDFRSIKYQQGFVHEQINKEQIYLTLNSSTFHLTL